MLSYLWTYLKSIPARLDPRLCVTRETISGLIAANAEVHQNFLHFSDVICEIQDARYEDDFDHTRLEAALVIRLGGTVVLSDDMLEATYGADYCEVIRMPDPENNSLILSVTFDPPEGDEDGEV